MNIRNYGYYLPKVAVIAAIRGPRGGERKVSTNDCFFARAAGMPLKDKPVNQNEQTSK